MTPLRVVSIVAATATLGLAGCTQTRYSQMAHHGGAAPAPGQAMFMAGPGGPMAHMDDHMIAMRSMHDRMSRARTPEERNALMDEQHKLMQDCMGMMGGMGPGVMGGMMGPGPGLMAGDPAERQQWMEKRMEMMQSMMQMMMDRLPPEPPKP